MRLRNIEDDTATWVVLIIALMVLLQYAAIGVLLYLAGWALGAW